MSLANTADIGYVPQTSEYNIFNLVSLSRVITNIHETSPYYLFKIQKTIKIGQNSIVSHDIKYGAIFMSIKILSEKPFVLLTKYKLALDKG